MLPTITLSSATKARRCRRAHDDRAARQALAAVVVGVALEPQLDAAREPGAEALAGRALAGAPRCSPRAARPRRARARSHRTADRRPRGSCSRCGARAAPAGRPRWRAGSAGAGRRRSSRRAPGRAGAPGAAARRGRTFSGTASSGVRSTPRAFQWSTASSGLEQLRAPDQLVDRAHAELRHQPARLLGDHEQVVDDVLGLALEARAQLGILGRDPDRAGVEVADAHHHAAERDQRRGREAELVGPEDRGDHDVAAGAHLTVDLDEDARAQVVAQQRLLGLREPDLPGDAGVVDRRLRRSAGAAVVPGDHDVVGVRLGDAGRDGPHAHLGHELDRDAGARVRAAQVVDQLLEVLDRVDVVVRRRRDQADARASSGAGGRCSGRPCGRGAGRPRRASRPGRP